MTTSRPGYVWDGTEWVSFGPEVGPASVAYQNSAPTSPLTGDLWVDADEDVPNVNPNLYLTTASATSTYSPISTTGLVLINSSAFTAQSSVSLPNNTFTSSYTNYLIKASLTASTSTNLQVRLRASGVDNSTASSYLRQRVTFNGATTTSSADGGANSWNTTGSSNFGTSLGFFEINVYQPQVTGTTAIEFKGGTADREISILNGLQNQSLSFDSLTFFPGSGTISGKYWVYGLKD